MRYLSLLAGALTLIAPAVAQTWTACNPMNTTCPNDPALGINHTFYLNQSSTVTNSFNITAGTLDYGANGTEFKIAQKGDSPTIRSQFYIFFGSVEIVMKAAYGQGIVSSIVLESDDLDEVDWEFLGGNGTHAETNYFGKGNTTLYNRAIYYPVGSDPRADFHNYTVHWTSAKLEWYIDSNLVRTLEYADADGGYDYPQTPMTVRMGIWAGGDPGNAPGTIEWAGGPTDYSDCPFTMYVQSAQVKDFSTGSAYEYTDHSGSWESIKVIPGNSTAATVIAQAAIPSESISQKFAALPKGTKIAFYCGGGAAGALLVSAFLFMCLRQRRAGRRERDEYNAKVEKERELACQEQVELREKGLGGWDKGAYEKLGDDALGGWGGSHATQDNVAADVPNLPKKPDVAAMELPRSPGSPASARLNNAPAELGTPIIPRLTSPPTSTGTPTIPRLTSPPSSAATPTIPNLSNPTSAARQTPTIPRLASPPILTPPTRAMSPQIISPLPQKAWNNGNVGGMIKNPNTSPKSKYSNPRPSNNNYSSPGPGPGPMGRGNVNGGGSGGGGSPNNFSRKPMPAFSPQQQQNFPQQSYQQQGYAPRQHNYPPPQNYPQQQNFRLSSRISASAEGEGHGHGAEFRLSAILSD